MLPVLTSPRGLRNETRVGVATEAEFMSLRTSERVSFLPILEESAVEELEAATDADWASAERNRFAQDLGAAGAEAGMLADSETVEESTTLAAEAKAS